MTGDGSIQMNIQELSTAMQYNLPVKIINLNNRYLGMVKQWQDMIYQSRHSHSYMESVPNFVEISEAYGHKGVFIDNPDTLEEDLKDFKGASPVKIVNDDDKDIDYDFM